MIYKLYTSTSTYNTYVNTCVYLSIYTHIHIMCENMFVYIHADIRIKRDPRRDRRFDRPPGLLFRDLSALVPILGDDRLQVQVLGVRPPDSRKTQLEAEEAKEDDPWKATAHIFGQL